MSDSARASWWSEPLHLVYLSAGGAAPDGRRTRAAWCAVGRDSAGAPRRDLRGAGRRTLLHQRGDRDRGRRDARRRSLQAPARERRRRSTSPPCTVPQGPQQRTSRRTPSRSAAAWRATTSTPCSTAKARLHAERPLPRRRHAACGQPHRHRPREAALHQPRALQGHPRRRMRAASSTARSRAPGRAEDRREADQQEPAALRARTRTINTKPQLEIFADDVKCTHGATVGQLDAGRALLPARRAASAASEARDMLTYAFAGE